MYECAFLSLFSPVCMYVCMYVSMYVYDNNHIAHYVNMYLLYVYAVTTLAYTNSILTFKKL